MVFTGQIAHRPTQYVCPVGSEPLTPPDLTLRLLSTGLTTMIRIRARNFELQSHRARAHTHTYTRGYFRVDIDFDSGLWLMAVLRPSSIDAVHMPERVIFLLSYFIQGAGTRWR